MGGGFERVEMQMAEKRWGGTSEQNTEFKEAEPTRNNQGLLMRLASYAETQQRAASSKHGGFRWKMDSGGGDT